MLVVWVEEREVKMLVVWVEERAVWVEEWEVEQEQALDLNNRHPSLSQLSQKSQILQDQK